MARTLASAWVSISPSGFADFGRKAKEGIKTALRGADATVPVKADTKPAGTDLDKLKARLAEFSRTVATARASVDTKQAAADLAKMDVRLDKLSRKVSSPRLTLEGVKAAEAELLGFEATFDRVSKKTSGGGGGSRTALPSLAGAAGVTGLAGVAAGGLGALPAIAAAGVGIGAFGALALPTIKGISNAMTQLNADTDAYNRAVTKASKNTALAHIKTDLAGLSPGQRAAVTGIQQLEAEFSRLSKALAPLTLKVLNDGLKLADNLLPALAPFAKEAGNAIDGLVRSASKFTQTAGFKSFVAELTKLSGPAITTIGEAVGQIAVAVGKLLKALASPGGLAVFAASAAGLATAITAVANGFAFLDKHVSPAILHDVGTSILAIYGAVKLWAIAQGTLDALLAANPIGLLVIALTAVAAAFIIAWRNSSTFRDFLKSVGIVFIDIGEVFVNVAKGIVDVWLATTGAIIHAAAVAFGWVPGLGSKLKGADQAFQGLRTGVDKSFDGIIGKMEDWKRSLADSINQSAKARGLITSDFNAQGQAASKAKTDLDKYSNSIAVNGVNSAQAASKRQQLVKDMESAGVSAKTANKDVDAYSGAIRTNGLNSDQAKAARDRLNNDIKTAFKNSQQGKTDITNLTNAIRQHGIQSDQSRSARQRLITDLENSGLDAKTAKTLVNNLETAIKNLKGKTVPVGVHGTGSGGVQVTPSTGVPGAKNFSVFFKPLARGGLLPGFGGGDRIPAMLEAGEAVIDKHRTRVLAPLFKRIGVPGFAAGGLVGAQNAIAGGGASDTAAGAQVDINAIVRAIKSSIAQAQASAQAGLGNLPLGLGPHSGSAAVAQAFAKSILWAYGWGANQFPPLQALWNQESGWNAYAVNASSGAYGIPQSLGHGHPYNLGDYQAQIRWGLAYIKQRYGSPAAAEAHERAFNWYSRGGLVKSYDAGGYLAPGMNLAWNGTGRPEPVGPAAGGVQLHLTVNGPVGSQSELENWFVKTANQAARTGRLTQAVKRAGG